MADPTPETVSVPRAEIGAEYERAWASVRALVERAWASVRALVEGERFTMSVPPRLDFDHDIVIGTALRRIPELLDALASRDAELARLRKRVEDYENREAAVCPEDRGFEEVIASLRAALAERDAEPPAQDVAFAVLDMVCDLYPGFNRQAIDALLRAMQDRYGSPQYIAQLAVERAARYTPSAAVRSPEEDR